MIGGGTRKAKFTSSEWLCVTNSSNETLPCAFCGKGKESRHSETKNLDETSKGHCRWIVPLLGRNQTPPRQLPARFRLRFGQEREIHSRVGGSWERRRRGRQCAKGQSQAETCSHSLALVMCGCAIAQRNECSWASSTWISPRIHKKPARICHFLQLTESLTEELTLQALISESRARRRNSAGFENRGAHRYGS